MKHIVEAKQVLSRVLWPDAHVDRLVIDFDDFKILLKPDAGQRLWLVCGGYVGYEVIGFWDEVIVESISVSDTGAFLDRCAARLTERLGDLPVASGSPARNARHLMQLDVKFIDGCQMTVAMNALGIQSAEVA